jgi:glyoxylase-like metal-dependent hydrolase (beta-lactamase superfamily II)
MQITEHVHALKIPFQVKDTSGMKIPRFVCIYLIYGRKITLIDSGVASSEQIILDYLNKTGKSPKDIALLILTHAHPDHIGAAKALKSMSGCAVAAHAAEKTWIEDVDLQARERPVPGFKSLIKGSVPVDLILQDGDVLDLGDGLSLQVLHTPGHSPGSISLWLPQEGALFSADAIPTVGGMPVYEDIRDSARSIQRLKSVQGIKVLLSAWDEPRLGIEAYRSMNGGQDFLQRIHDAVIGVADVRLDSMELCRRVLEELGLPRVMANPLMARSFQASLSMLDQRDLLQD